MDEDTLRIDESQIEQDLDQFDFDDYLIDQLEQIHQLQKALDVTFQVWLTNSKEILTNA